MPNTFASTRILRRLQQGKRNVHGLSSAERRYIQNIIGFQRVKETQRQWENRLETFLQDTGDIVGSEKFFNAVNEATNEARKS